MSTIEQLNKAHAKFPDIGTPVLEAAIKGDEDAKGQVYGFYHNGVMAYLYRSYIPPQELEDCGQDVWERVFRRLPHYEIQPNHSFRPFVIMTARSVKVDYYRKYQVQKEYAAEQIRLSSTHPFFWPEEAVEILELYQAIGRQIEHIEPHQAQAFYYKYFMGLSHHDSAEMLGTSEDNARQLASRGLGRIRLGLKRESLD